MSNDLTIEEVAKLLTVEEESENIKDKENPSSGKQQFVYNFRLLSFKYREMNHLIISLFSIYAQRLWSAKNIFPQPE